MSVDEDFTATFKLVRRNPRFVRLVDHLAQSQYDSQTPRRDAEPRTRTAEMGI